jgi:inhibitor of cysteine peptidase
MQLTYEDSGSTRPVSVGEYIKVSLAENPTTAYRWEIEGDQTALRQLDDRFDGPTIPRGASGTRVLSFEALHPGKTQLRLLKRRSWEKKAIDEFVVDLEVGLDDMSSGPPH